MSRSEAGRPSLRWGFIGAGKMATALIRGMLRGRHAARVDLGERPRPGGPRGARWRRRASRRHESNVEVAGAQRRARPGGQAADDGRRSWPSSGRPITPDHLVVSVAAGVSLATLAEGLGADRRIVRVMPNTPALVGEGAAAYCLGPHARDRRRGDRRARASRRSAGRSGCPRSLLDAVTGLSGSGPAFVYVMIEALSDGGVRVGLPREIATALAAQTVLGAAKMVLETGQHPGVLKDQVTSPGGTTIAGLHALERGGRPGRPDGRRRGRHRAARPSWPRLARRRPRAARMKLGLISDVHGDPVALELAWAHLTVLGADRIVCAGDLVGYGPPPDRVVAFLVEHGIASVRGNHDRWALRTRPGRRPTRSAAARPRRRRSRSSQALPADLACRATARGRRRRPRLAGDDMEFVTRKDPPARASSTAG